MSTAVTKTSDACVMALAQAHPLAMSTRKCIRFPLQACTSMLHRQSVRLIHRLIKPWFDVRIGAECHLKDFQVSSLVWLVLAYDTVASWSVEKLPVILSLRMG